ncbi:MAG TPA: transcription antitermination factor NusB [Planctomycetota bacterium]|nr:transcription antitermination factor NusB [Planctomycetota bacterium]
MTAPIRRRTRAREIAMQVLFQFDLRGADYAEELGQTPRSLCAEQCEGEADVLDFAVRLVEGTLAHRAEIDLKLQSVTRNWDLRRMANVDRNVLRMAMYELMFCRDVPPKVAINEAIDIGKKYSTANSGGFVNGILDRVRIDIEHERAAPAKVAPSEPDRATGGQTSGVEELGA